MTRQQEQQWLRTEFKTHGSVQAVAEAHGVSVPTVYRWCSDLEVKPTSTITCETCGKEFVRKGGRGRLPKYCSAKCRRAGSTKREQRRREALG